MFEQNQMKILMVAGIFNHNFILIYVEKPSIAKSVSNLLGGGSVRTRNGKNKYCKNYDFDYKINGIVCECTMTCVSLVMNSLIVYSGNGSFNAAGL